VENTPRKMPTTQLTTEGGRAEDIIAAIEVWRRSRLRRGDGG